MLESSLVDRLRSAVGAIGACLIGFLGAVAPFPLRAARPDGALLVSAIDEKTGEPLAVRIELRDARGRPVRLRPREATVAGANIYFAGSTTLELRRGAYRFVVEAGPEYLTRQGSFTIDRHAEDSVEVTLTRRVDMQQEGWLAGDLDVQLPLADLPVMMTARGVDFVPIAAMVNDRGRCRKLKQAGGTEANSAATDRDGTPLLYGPWATLDDRQGGGLLTVGAQELVDVCHWKLAEPMLSSAIASAEAGGCVTALSPLAWELPAWIAAGKIDAVQVINRYCYGDDSLAERSQGRPRDEALFPGPTGLGRYSEAIYHHLLNCGLRLPPAAGSGVGVRAIDAPLGAHRVYVRLGDEPFSRETWLAGLKAGRVSITNGPLLRTSIEGHPPGHVFQLEKGERREVQVALDLAFYAANQVEYLEILQNGRTLHHVRLDELTKRAGRLPPVVLDSSGWFLVRAVTNNSQLHQFASTGPYYVESNYEPRISRGSVEFFLEWLDDAAQKFVGNDAMLAELDAARPFWTKLLEQANAD